MTLEREFIRGIQSCGIVHNPDVVKGIGDDCAVYKCGDADCEQLYLVSTDTLVEGTHFNLGWHPPELLGRKAAAVNLSDIAAMGGVPLFALLSVGVPSEYDAKQLDLFLKGFKSALSDYRVMLIGGDTVNSKIITFSITVIGESKEDIVLYRSGANPGDTVWVSGLLGQASAGLKIFQGDHAPRERWSSLIDSHLSPEPELQLGKVIAESGLATAMIDMSDGLCTDMAHICEESGVGAVIWAKKLPMSAEMKHAAKNIGFDPLQAAISGGEDYRLLFTCMAGQENILQKHIKKTLGHDIFCVGEIVRGEGVKLSLDEKVVDVSFQGFDHFT